MKINIGSDRLPVMVLLDAEDIERVTNYRWELNGDSQIVGKIKGVNYILSRYILSYKGFDEIDHEDGNIFNNVRINLRIASHQQNSYNRGANFNNTSGYKGVSFHKKNKNWRAFIKVNGVQIHLGSFKSLEKAARAYDKAAREYHKEFARLNFPDKIDYKMFETGFTSIYEHCKREVEEIKGEKMQGKCYHPDCRADGDEEIDQKVIQCENCGKLACPYHSSHHPGSFAVPECVQCDECRGIE